MNYFSKDYITNYYSKDKNLIKVKHLVLAILNFERLTQRFCNASEDLTKTLKYAEAVLDNLEKAKGFALTNKFIQIYSKYCKSDINKNFLYSKSRLWDCLDPSIHKRIEKLTSEACNLSYDLQKIVDSFEGITWEQRLDFIKENMFKTVLYYDVES